VLAAAHSLRNATDLLAGAVDAYRRVLGLVADSQPILPEVAALATLAEALEGGRERDLSIAFHGDFARTADDLTALVSAIAAYRDAEQRLAATFLPAQVRSLDPDALDRQWREANASLWPLSALGRRRVMRLLQSYAETGTTRPDQDLPQLRRMKEQLATIDGTP
ncbi:MAG: hypothetical protein ACOVN2_07225, partial [Usitatibacteraceae bacterium]